MPADSGLTPEVAMMSEAAAASSSASSSCGPWTWEIGAAVTPGALADRAAELLVAHDTHVTDAWEITWGADPLAASWWSMSDPVPRTLSLALPNGTCSTWQLAMVDDVVGARHAWLGRAADGNRGSIYLIDDANGLRLAWFSWNGVQGIVAQVGEQTWLMRGHRSVIGGDDVEDDGPVTLPAEDRALLTADRPLAVPNPPPPGGGTQIDILVSYTPARLNETSLGAVLDDVAKGASWLNLSFLNSQLSTTARILAVEDVGASEGGHNTVESLHIAFKSDPQFAALRARRDAVGADFHALLPRRSLGGAVSGRAPKLQNLAGNPAKHRAVVRDFGVGDVFAHELGHMLGGGHDTLTVDRPGGNFCFGQPGPIQFCPDKAFVHVVANGGVVDLGSSFRTTMAFPDGCRRLVGPLNEPMSCDREPVFSSGSYAYLNVYVGIPLDIDNQVLMAAVVDDVANYRTALVSPYVFAPATITSVTRAPGGGGNDVISYSVQNPTYGPYRVEVAVGTTLGADDLFTDVTCAHPPATTCSGGTSYPHDFPVPAGTPVFLQVRTTPYFSHPVLFSNASNAVTMIGCDRDPGVQGAGIYGGTDCDVPTGTFTAGPACTAVGDTITCDLAIGADNLGAVPRSFMGLSAADPDWDYVFTGVNKAGDSFCCLYNDAPGDVEHVVALGSSKFDRIAFDDNHMSLCGAFVDGVAEARQGPDELFGSRCAVPGYGESLLGELGDDTLRGADGADVLDGGQGTDLLFGEQGVDVLMDPGGVDDQLTGGADGDFLCSKGTGAVLFGPDPAYGTEANLIFASASGGAPGVSQPGGAGSSCGSPVWGAVWSGGLACTVNTVAFCAGY